MLTLQNLKDFSPGIFAIGEGEIRDPDGYNGEMVPVRWVAVRGQIEDWAIYHSYGTDTSIRSSPDTISRVGTKLYDGEKIKEWVPCDKEAFDMYRP